MLLADILTDTLVTPATRKRCVRHNVCVTVYLCVTMYACVCLSDLLHLTGTVAGHPPVQALLNVCAPPSQPCWSIHQHSAPGSLVRVAAALYEWRQNAMLLQCWVEVAAVAAHVAHQIGCSGSDP